jgi:hypothetical protein
MPSLTLLPSQHTHPKPETQVLTARLYLPLSSMDSEDEAQLLYAVTYRGAVSLTRVTNSDAALTSGVTSCRAIFPLASDREVRRGGLGMSQQGAGNSSSSSSSSSGTAQVDGQRQSKVDQKAGAPLTRSPASFKSFALDLPADMDDDSSSTSSGGGDTSARNSGNSSSSSSSGSGGAGVGRSTASAPTRPTRPGQPPAGQTSSQTSGQKQQVLEDPAMLVVRCYDPEVSGDEDIGAVAVDVERWLAGGGANWEGWVKLDKVGDRVCG